ncbi:type II toxin-antitoxin system RelE/ParE family toxin [Rothia mucilaginosa]|uniref:type II toxin-antitoxin system RelE/ParE family toxin n=1 Tax=Rothia mucilaginosa TaxID=43675 RepID=UPI0028F10178|nr:type II toxin-antitoxin system RelE/ParE family toxin [Rothia mucilaginosa]
MSTWNIDFRHIRSWLEELSDNDYEQVAASIQVLKREGPALGRPLVDNVKGSTIKNLKELRPGSSGQSKIRILFVFDSHRQAVMLVAGDKSGNWNKWYRTNIPRAEQIYKEHLRNS